MNPSDAVHPLVRTAHAGRRPVTSRAQISTVAIDLFTARGFEETSVDDVADAVGIARRTLFRYYPSKNAIAWGDFDGHLAEMRALLAEIPDDLPIAEALGRALISFNEVPDTELTAHRRRMSLLLGVPALQAHSMLMYAEWRQVIADFCAHRLHLGEDEHLPQTIAWMCLGTALAAYEQWLAHPGSDLEALIVAGTRTLSQGVGALS
ncbi:mycofactocin system transcriptional regulator [Gordonia hankookensis]|uniref:Mycofactocin system transcriptional regulator n=1 Tax=Gordonia hankookensis TaxID=589403 RepID=A0ABR7W8B0_9ACTN|nr:mycofactocin system transcriptional regulator [Gordonia hankookensis]MBD1318840.1 mycofactocin system transcriptional regulator [Gordonia hankookensis]NDZ94360.1 mycofactocin system transcriptional regulator [Streptomyces sp. SID11726]NEB24990.1 mycofactocin system transcriptional regulator [Streptomyces sp. SID6673]